MGDYELITLFLETEIDKGQEAWEMCADGFGGNAGRYIDEYRDDYEVVRIDGETYIRRKGYDEYWNMSGKKCVM